MKKLAILLCLVLIAVPAVYAKSVPAFGYTGASTYNPTRAGADRYQSIAWGRTFTRQMSDGAHPVMTQTIDKKTKTVTYIEMHKGKKTNKKASYDASGMGYLDIGGKKFKFFFNEKHNSARVAYLPTA